MTESFLVNVAAMNDTSAVSDPVRHLIRLTNAVTASRALHVVAELGIADTIAPDEEAAVDVIAGRCGCDPGALHRVLRLLEVHGVFRSERDCWSHTAASVVLRDDHPRTVRAYARMIGQPSTWDALTQLASTLRAGRPAPFLVEAGGIWSYFEQHPEQLAVFAQAMAARAQAAIAGIVATIDFSPYQTIADIAGGRGHLVRAIVDHHPHVQGILFELPHVIDEVEHADHHPFGRHPGDFFVDPLPAADLSILMQVIHDWDDDDAARILSAVAEAATPGDSLMLVELVLPECPVDDGVNTADVFMLMLAGGRERTAGEYTTLLDRAGYDVTDIRPVAGPYCAITSRRR
ncbi:MAG: methyltransferase [Ilumatobacteraceae bacterium]